MTTRLEQIKARLEAASNLNGATWDGIKINEESGYTHVPECSTLGDTLIMLSHDYEGDGEDCIFLQNAYSDLAALLRIAEAAERWEEADVKLYAAEKSIPPGIGKIAAELRDNYHTALDEWGRTKYELAAAVRSFREGGGEG